MTWLTDRRDKVKCILDTVMDNEQKVAVILTKIFPFNVFPELFTVLCSRFSHSDCSAGPVQKFSTDVDCLRILYLSSTFPLWATNQCPAPIKRKKIIITTSEEGTWTYEWQTVLLN